MRLRRDWLAQPDTINAILFLVIGAGALVYSLSSLKIGSLSRLGPGGFSIGLGIVLMLFGVVMLWRSFSSGVGPIGVPLRVPVVLLGSLVAFAFMIPLFGALPAIAVLVAISTLADRGTSLRSRALLVLVLCFIAWLVFSVALGMPLEMLDWPF